MQNSQLKSFYELIESARAKYGRFKKCEVHLHTPASYDYELIKGMEYNKLTLDDIYNLSIEVGYLTKESVAILKKDEELYLTEEYINNLTSTTPFDNLKDYLAYGLIAHKLYQESVEVVIISDHNTLKGYKKLKYTINEYYEKNIKNKAAKEIYIDVLAGIEISCSDKHHLIAIIDKANLEKFESYLSDILLSEEGGTYLDSRYLIEYLHEEFDAITYLAHLNSSKYLGSGAYNSKLFSLSQFKLLGTKDVSQIDSIKNRIRGYIGEKVNRFEMILEGDAHCTEDIGLNNSWIKFNDVNFDAFKKALENRSICIRVAKPNGGSRFIKGIAILPGDKGFLKGDEENDAFLLSFSKDLNSIIGGRGSGKSTLLNILEVILTREVDNQNILDFISSHKSIYCVFYLEGIDYILRFIPLKKNRDDYYYLEEDDLYSGISKIADKIHLTNAWIELYQVEEGIIKEVDRDNYDLILNRMFRRGYNINKLVAKINDNTISEFIRETVTYGISYNSIEHFEQKIKMTPKNSFAKTVREIMPSNNKIS